MTTTREVSRESAAPSGAMRATKPLSHEPGKRWSNEHWRLEVFDLARYYKGHPGYKQKKLDELKPVVKKWHMNNSRYMGSRSFEETWARFRKSWLKVKKPKGEIIKGILRRAKNAPEPKETRPYQDAALKLLVKLCRELWRHWEKKPFPLDCRTAGECIGKSHETALDWLDMLVDDGLLDRVTKGRREKGKKSEASTYRYRGKL